jgi:hypothetical protein
MGGGGRASDERCVSVTWRHDGGGQSTRLEKPRLLTGSRRHSKNWLSSWIVSASCAEAKCGANARRATNTIDVNLIFLATLKEGD